MSTSTVRELLRNLEGAVRDRIRVIEDVVLHSDPTDDFPELGSRAGTDSTLSLVADIASLREEVKALTIMLRKQNDRITSFEVDLEKARAQAKDAYVKAVDMVELLPSKPMKGLEVVPAKIVQVVLPEKVAPKVVEPVVEETDNAVEVVEEEEEEAVEEEVVEEEVVEEEAVEEEVVEEAEETVEEAEETMEEAEEEAEETVEEAEEAEEEEEGLELEEFEYKGVTYYRDNDNNVYAQDENGEPDVETIIGTWNTLKQRILPKAK